MSNVHDALLRVRERLSDPEHWCQGGAAYRQDGTPVHPDDPEATAWCLSGAICAETAAPALGHGDVLLANAVVAVLKRRVGGRGSHLVSNYNDSHTHAEVLALLDQAIAETEKKR